MNPLPFRATPVVVILRQELTYCRGILRGVKEFAESRPEWTIISIPPDLAAHDILAPLKPAGLIAHLGDERIAQAVLGLGRPFVNVSAALRNPPAPRVGVADRACGRLAAEHFLDRAFRHFAFIGRSDQLFSIAREHGFRQRLRVAGHRIHAQYEAAVYPTSGNHAVRLLWQDRAVHDWVRALERPCGVFAANDIWGLQLTEVCRQSHVQVPEEVSIVGVHNDDLLCDLARPSLSSIPVPEERIGHAAAALLDRLLRGGRTPRRPLLFDPEPVIPRRSSDMLAIDDVEVALAVGFIRREGHRPLRIGDVVGRVTISRRLLERRFRNALGRSLLDEIRRVHIERARRLLTETDFPMSIVAERAGFTDSRQLSVVFRQCLGVTPTDFRQATRSPTRLGRVRFR